MIRIARRDEPRGLKTVAPRRLTAAVKAFNQSGGQPAALKDLLAGYGSRATKLALFRAQHGKCAWCERNTDFSSAPVEHYRPKDGAWRNLPDKPRIIDKAYYWWLTWTWSNLLLSCVRCNDAGHKANYFPLHPGTSCAAAPVAPLQLPPLSSIADVSTEQPLLINPAGSADPMDHIEWLPSNTSFDRRDWIWTPEGRTEQGRATVEILKLGELADRAQGHVRKQLLPSIEEIEKHVTAGRIEDARQRWDRLLEDTLEPSAEWSAFTWHALRRLVTHSYRLQYQLAEPPKPGAAPP